MAAPTSMPEMARRGARRAPAAAGLRLEAVGDGAARLRCGCGRSRRRDADEQGGRAHQRERGGPEARSGDDEWRQLPSSCVRTPRALPIRKLPAGTLTHRGRHRHARPGCTRHGTWRPAREFDVRDPPRRARVAHHRFGWSRRPARQHVGHTRRGAVPDRDVGVAGAAATGAAARTHRAGGARQLVRLALAGAQPGARPRTTALPAGGRAARRPTAPVDQAEEVGDRRPGSTPSAASRPASRTAAAPIATTDRPKREVASQRRVIHVAATQPRSGGVCEAAPDARAVAGPVVRAGDRPPRPGVRLGDPHLRAAPGGDADRHARRVHRAPVVFNLIARAARTYNGRDSVMSLFGPIGLLTLPGGVGA